MKKKQIIGLGTLLLVLLLGLFTTSYADITEENIKNFVYNASVEFGSPVDDSLFERTNYLNWYNGISSIINSTDFFIYAQWGTSNGQNVNLEITLQTFTNFTQNWSMNPNNNIFYIRSQYQGAKNYRYNVSNDIYTYRADYDSAINDPKLWYTTRNIYNFNNTSQLIYQAPYSIPDNVFDGKYSALGFSFVPAYSDTFADVWSFEDIPFYSVTQNEDLFLGQLFLPFGSRSSITSRTNFYYRYNNWQFRELPVDAIYSQYLITDNEVAVYDIYLQSKYFYENTVYSIVWTDKSVEPYNIASANFYIKNINTIIINGVLSPTYTFSGDYKEQYDNNLNNQEQQNNIENAIDNTINTPADVDNILNNFTSGDFASTLGYIEYDSSYWDFLYAFTRKICDTLLDDTDVYFDYSMHGETPTRIYASDINLPEGHPLKSFVRLAFVFGVVFTIYYQFKNLIEALETANAAKVMQLEDADMYFYKM